MTTPTKVQLLAAAYLLIKQAEDYTEAFATDEFDRAILKSLSLAAEALRRLAKEMP